MGSCLLIIQHEQHEYTSSCQLSLSVQSPLYAKRFKGNLHVLKMHMSERN